MNRRVVLASALAMLAPDAVLSAPQTFRFDERPAEPPPDLGVTEEADDEFAKLELGEEGLLIDGSLFLQPDIATIENYVRRWRPAASLVKLRDEIDAKAPRRSRRSDGTIGDRRHQSRKSDHNPWIIDGTVGVVSAIDITHDPSGGCDIAQIAEELRERKDGRIKYVIWNRRLFNSQVVSGRAAWEWRTYRGANPHTSHMHVSVRSTKEWYDSREPWRI